MTTSGVPAAGPDGLDLDALTAYLHSRGVPLAGPMRGELISGGKSNLTYLLGDGNQEFVLRRPPLGTIPRGAHDVAREYRVMAALAGSAVPVPAMVALCVDDAVIGVPFYVMEAVPGLVLRDRDLVERVPEAVRARLGGALVDTLADLHEIEPAEVGLSDLGRPDGYLRRQLDRWVRQYHAIKVRDLDHAELVGSALQASLPATSGIGIVHGDYRLDNVIVDRDDMSRIAAVLDWEMATLGDPLADLAGLVMFWDEPGRPFNPITKGLTALNGFPTPNQVVERYVTRRGLVVDNLDWYLVFARYRLAILLEQIHIRHIQGKTRGEGFDGIGDIVVLLLAQCREAVDASPRMRQAGSTAVRLDPEQRMPQSHEEGRRAVSAAAAKVLAEHPPGTTPVRQFLGACFDAGLAWVHFPLGRGGLGVDAGLQDVADGMLANAGGVNPFQLNPMGYGMAGPTVVAHALEEIKTRLLRPMYTCEHIWCQLFSEPGAGSDLAGLATRAVPDGDEWVVNGQKIWTSLGHVARWGLLLARTDPNVAKHKGLTYFVVDMHSPGVEVRPLRQMTGEAEFNEVFLSDVRIPDIQRLGGVGEGWRVAMTTLMNERKAIGGGSSVRNSGFIRVPLRLWGQRPDLRTPVLQERLVTLFARAEAARLTGDRHRIERAGGPIGPEGSAAKLVWAELSQDIFEFCMDFLGPEATVYSGYDQDHRPEDLGDGVMRWTSAEREDDVQRMFLRSRAFTIEGGTSDVLRNVVGERVLGLPGDLRADRDKPWADVPRS